VAAEMLSLEISGLIILLCPLAKEATATARIVCDFEAGTETLPFNRDFPTLSCIFIVS
jgi:hypothetical protein